MINVSNKRIKQVIVLYGATFASILLGVAVSVTTTRFLGKEQFGDFRYVNNILTFLSSLVYFGFFVTGARLLAVSKEESKSGSIKGALIIYALVAFLLLEIFIAFTVLGHYIIGQNKMAFFFISVAPLAIVFPLQNMLENVFQGENKMYSLSILRTFSQLLFLIVSFFVFTRYSVNATDALLIQLGLNLIIAAPLLYFSRPSFLAIRQSMQDLVSANNKYGLHVYVGSLFGVTTTYIAGITLGIFNDMVSVGFFSLAVTISGPLSLIPGLVGTAFYKDFSEMKSIPSKILSNTVKISLSILIVYCFAISYVIQFLYGEQYSEVSKIIIPLAIGTTAHGFGDLFNRFMGSHGHGKILRNIAVLVGICVIFGNTVIIYYWGINGAVFTRFFCGFFYLACTIYFYNKLQ